MNLEPSVRRLFYGLFITLVILICLITLIEILRVPVGACEANAASAACARQRIVILLPWAGMGVAVTLYALRLREQRHLPSTVIVERKGGKPLARLYVIDGPPGLVSKNLNVQGNLTAIGRDPALTDIQLYHPRDRSSISARHCTIRYDRGQFTLIDHNTPNGTQLNGRPLQPDKPAVLRDGDEITLGDSVRQGAILRFQTALPTLGLLPAIPPESAAPLPAEDLNKTGLDLASDSRKFRLGEPADSAESASRREKRSDDPLEAFFSSLETPARPAAKRRAAPVSDATPRSAQDKTELNPDDDQAWLPNHQAVDDSWMDSLS
jgi:hypothetical protein